MQLPKRNAGFTLVEIMMAIGILAIGMTGVTALYAVAVDAHRRAMDNSGMAFLAESMLCEIRADFTKRDTDFDDEQTATFTESFIDLACRYKRLNESGDYVFEEGVPAPNSAGLNCEVSIYPLPRTLWADLPFDPVPADVTARIVDTIDDPDARSRAAEEYQFDAWLLGTYWDNSTGLPDIGDTNLNDILLQAVEYKLVVRIILGEGDNKDVETFRTIILPGSVVDQAP